MARYSITAIKQLKAIQHSTIIINFTKIITLIANFIIISLVLNSTTPLIMEPSMYFNFKQLMPSINY